MSNTLAKTIGKKQPASTGLSQAAFAKLLGVSVRTLQEWEQGRKMPSGAAATLLKVASRHPEVLQELAAAQPVAVVSMIKEMVASALYWPRRHLRI